MRIYKCIVSGDEMFSDIYKISEDPKGIIYEVEGKLVSRTEGGIDDSLIGGNASQECPTEQSENLTVSGVDIVLNHHLKEVSFKKNEYRTYIKEYMKRLKDKIQKENPDAVQDFTNNAQAVVADILKKFGDYQFYTGESMNCDGIVGLLDYRADDTPYMVFFKDGLEIEKC
ncbi:translationally-controlled tumor protein homolog [Pristis pectinata]|uniref:translationally-controlled tumor protein homolog n=1 Tax=Pristis pectinata TaxID=685728 RepID=UPI00223CA7A4|nr:translationally-controlled tumor protein homolog [Pristis pectinata]